MLLQGDLLEHLALNGRGWWPLYILYMAIIVQGHATSISTRLKTLLSMTYIVTTWDEFAHHVCFLASFILFEHIESSELAAVSYWASMMTLPFIPSAGSTSGAGDCRRPGTCLSPSWKTEPSSTWPLESQVSEYRLFGVPTMDSTDVESTSNPRRHETLASFWLSLVSTRK